MKNFISFCSLFLFVCSCAPDLSELPRPHNADPQINYDKSFHILTYGRPQATEKGLLYPVVVYIRYKKINRVTHVCGGIRDSAGVRDFFETSTIERNGTRVLWGLNFLYDLDIKLNSEKIQRTYKDITIGLRKNDLQRLGELKATCRPTELLWEEVLTKEVPKLKIPPHLTYLTRCPVGNRNC